MWEDDEVAEVLFGIQLGFGCEWGLDQGVVESVRLVFDHTLGC